MIRKAETAENGQIVVALVDENEVTLKRLRRRGNSIALEPANQRYEVRLLPAERVRVQGRLVALLRRDQPSGMTDEDLRYAPAAELAGLMRKRALSPVELARAVLARVSRLEPTLNAFATLVGDQALEAAKAAEAAYIKGEPRPLEGIPVTIKDLAITKGIAPSAAPGRSAAWCPRRTRPASRGSRRPARSCSARPRRRSSAGRA